MSDNHDYLRTGASGNFRLKADALALMLKGAAYAAIFCLAIWFSLVALSWIGGLLPEDSRDTPDPTPYSYNLIIKDVDQA